MKTAEAPVFYLEPGDPYFNRRGYKFSSRGLLFSSRGRSREQPEFTHEQPRLGLAGPRLILTTGGSGSNKVDPITVNAVSRNDLAHVIIRRSVYIITNLNKNNPVVDY